ncbi:MAG: TIGR00730 family Rossman fold protein, partial [Sphingomicrobium sp.]
PALREAARELGRCLVANGFELVFGGGSVGLMGVVADAVMEAGGEAHGVIPQALVDLEVAHTGLTELHFVANMHERKAKMTDLADAFVCLPGGIGTLDEMFEAWTWNALGYHAQPFCLLNVHGFWDGLAGFMDHVVDSGFLSDARRLQLLKADTPAEALDLLDEAVKSAAQGVTW